MNGIEGMKNGKNSEEFTTEKRTKLCKNETQLEKRRKEIKCEDVVFLVYCDNCQND